MNRRLYSVKKRYVWRVSLRMIVIMWKGAELGRAMFLPLCCNGQNYKRERQAPVGFVLRNSVYRCGTSSFIFKELHMNGKGISAIRDKFDAYLPGGSQSWFAYTCPPFRGSSAGKKHFPALKSLSNWASFEVHRAESKECTPIEDIVAFFACPHVCCLNGTITTRQDSRLPLV
jgi:hypothetical protein